MTTSNRLGITELAETQNNRSITINEAIAKLEAGATFFAAIQVLVNAPPASPVEGDLYVVGTAGTGAWSGHNENVALYYNAAWLFFVPFEGMFAWDQTSNSIKRYDGADWVAYTVGAGGIADGDYGDITVSSSGSVWTIDNGAITNAKLATTAQAIGKTTIFIPASAMTIATTNGPATGQVETSSNKVNFSVLDFDATTAEMAWFHIAMPKGWDEGTVTFQAWWTTSATDTDGVAISLAGVALSDNDALDTAVGTPVVVTDDAQGAALEMLVTAESTAVTIAGTPAEGDMCYFRVQRVVSDGNDDMSEDMRLIGIKLFYTTNSANDA